MEQLDETNEMCADAAEILVHDRPAMGDDDRRELARRLNADNPAPEDMRAALRHARIVRDWWAVHASDPDECPRCHYKFTQRVE